MGSLWILYYGHVTTLSLVVVGGLLLATKEGWWSCLFPLELVEVLLKIAFPLELVDVLLRIAHMSSLVDYCYGRALLRIGLSLS